MTFDFFIKSNGLDDSFQATTETVSFENRNGKKFTFLISDVERCLKIIWESKERLPELLDKKWEYNEDKYRSALGEIFKSEEWNSVVSNLGSQTPNTVRCIELYAYFKLNKLPSSQLSKPEILYWKNLDPIFSKNDLRTAFEDWLRNEKGCKPKSISHYTTAVSGVLSRAAGRSLFEVSSADEVVGLKEKTLQDENIVLLNKNGNGMYLSAYNNYEKFCISFSGFPKKTDKVSFYQIPIKFNSALVDIGFFS